jgi:hypothetical protein
LDGSITGLVFIFMKEKPITHQINDTALKILKKNPKGVRTTELNKMIGQAHPDFHPKTINGCTWKLVEKFPDQVCKPERGLFKLK